MSSLRSKKEIVLIAAIGVSILATLGMAFWGATASGNSAFWLVVFYSPLFWVAVLGITLLIRRRAAGAWAALAFFGLQVVKVEREGALVWPPVSAVGINFELVRDSSYGIDVGISAIVFAFISAAVISQYREERILAGMPKVAPLLPPNTSLERTRDG
jgi:hypothetical protein